MSQWPQAHNVICKLDFSFPSIDPEVPPNADLSMEVELLEATDAPDLELLSPAERIALAGQKRERGNYYYQRGDYAFAVNSYSIALQITESSSKGELLFTYSLDSTLVGMYLTPLHHPNALFRIYLLLFVLLCYI